MPKRPYQHLLKANKAELGKALTSHFLFLADNDGFVSLLRSIMSEAHAVEVEDDELRVKFPDGKVLICAPPADSESYDEWPQSFQNIVTQHERLSYPNSDWGVSLGKFGNFEGEYLEEVDSELLGHGKSADEILNPMAEYSDWWLYHPDELDAVGEPALCFFSHEGDDARAPIAYSIGCLFLLRLAVDLDLIIELPKLERQVAGGPALLKWYAELPEGWREALSLPLKPDAAKIKAARKSERVSLARKGIADLRPLAAFPRLKYLDLSECPIDSIAALAQHQQLVTLALCDIKITDFSPLKGFSKLEELDVSGTCLESLHDLPELPLLNELKLGDTQLTSLDGIERFVNLIDLAIDKTGIADISSLKDLKLESFSCCDTQVADLSALMGKKSLISLSLYETQVGLQQILALRGRIIDHMRERGMSVFLGLDSKLISEDEVLLEQMAGLRELSAEESEALGELLAFWIKVRINRDEPDHVKRLLAALLVVPNFEPKEYGESHLKLATQALRFLANNNSSLANEVFERLVPKKPVGKDHCELAFHLAHYYARTRGKERLLECAAHAMKLGVEISRFKEGSFVYFLSDEDFQRLISTSHIPDPWEDPEGWYALLDEDTRFHLCNEVGEDRYAPDISRLLEVQRLRVADVASLEPLRFLRQLRHLELYSGAYSSIEPLAALVGLEKLVLEGSQYGSHGAVVDIAPLRRLTGLRSLVVRGHKVEDVSALANLTELRELNIRDNKIADISVLSNLIALESFILRGNPIEDLAVLCHFKKLKEISMVIPGGSNFDVIRQLDGLISIWAGDRCTSLAPFEHLEHLEYLHPAGQIDPDEAKAFRARHPNCNLSL